MTLWAPARLLSLVQSVSATLQCVPEHHSPPPCDYHCRLMSMPLALRSIAPAIPAEIPYLRVSGERIVHWREKLGDGEALKIGICWQGAVSRMDLGRSFPLAELMPLARLSGVRLISLQKGAGSEQIQGLPPEMKVESPPLPFDEGADAFLDAAAVMDCLDLVVTSDTAIAHLAGALGRPVWLALQKVPDWRWQLQRGDCPWYPSMRLFRQSEHGRWDTVFQRMSEELRRRPAP